MIIAQDQIVKFLSDRAKASWEDAEDPRPYLLSFAGADFKGAGIDYQSALAGERLKAFVERTEGSESYRVVKHPTQSAKIGLVPWGKDYQFEQSAPSAPMRDQVKLGATRGSLLIQFLNALETLPDNDIDQIVIPTRVLVKLARKK